MQSSEAIERYISQVKARRTADDFSVNVCRLLLPNGRYQHVDILRPHRLYQMFVDFVLLCVLFHFTDIRLIRE